MDVTKRDNASLARDTLSGWAKLQIAHWVDFGSTLLNQFPQGHSSLWVHKAEYAEPDRRSFKDQ